MPTLDQSSEVTIPNPAADPNQPKTPKTITLRFAGMGPTVRSNFARYIKQWAWQQLDSQRAIVGPDRWLRLEANLWREMSAGSYEWGDRIHVDHMEGARSGVVAEAIARLRYYHPEADEPLVVAIVEHIGWERLRKIMDQADGPELKNDPTPQSGGAKESPTNGLSQVSLNDSAGRTRNGSEDLRTDNSTPTISEAPKDLPKGIAVEPTSTS